MHDRALIVSASSDIGYHLAKHWIQLGKTVIGTFRSESEKVAELAACGARLLRCDLEDSQSIDRFLQTVSETPFSRVVLAAGTQNPIGLFADVDFDEWAVSIGTNLVSQLRVLHGLLAQKLLDDSRVLMFAGGGTNSATERYSAYTLGKVASIKAVELLAREYPRTCFSILGPGWVRTKIHEQTLENPVGAGDNFQVTRQHLEEDDFFPMERLIECIDWLFEEETHLISGRNFSAVHDSWGTPSLRAALESDSDLYKLRRHGNSLKL